MPRSNTYRLRENRQNGLFFENLWKLIFFKFNLKKSKRKISTNLIENYDQQNFVLSFVICIMSLPQRRIAFFPTVYFR